MKFSAMLHEIILEDHPIIPDSFYHQIFQKLSQRNVYLSNWWTSKSRKVDLMKHERTMHNIFAFLHVKQTYLVKRLSLEIVLFLLVKYYLLLQCINF